MWIIFFRLLATAYTVAPFAAIITVFFNPALALVIFMFWIFSAASIVATTLLIAIVAAIWSDL